MDTVTALIEFKVVNDWMHRSAISIATVTATVMVTATVTATATATNNTYTNQAGKKLTTTTT